MNTLTAISGYSSRITAAPRALPQLGSGTRVAAGVVLWTNWLERLASWYELQPPHRRLGSYTLMI